MEAKLTKLDNGLRVITATNPDVDSVALGVFVGVGSRHESARNAGMSHFVEHLLFKGTPRRTARRITQEIEGRGGYMNAYTQEESTCYYVRVTKEEFGRAFDVLSDMYLNPLLKPKDVEKERGVIIEEIKMYRDQPGHLVQEMLGEALWLNHPLGRSVAGSPESLRRAGRDDVADFKRHRYVPGNTVIAAAGNAGHEQCVSLAREFAAGMSGGKSGSFRKVTPDVPQLDLSLCQKDIKQSHLALGFRLPFGRSDGRRYALRLLSAALGENMSSRLFQVVRERHGLAYSVHSGIHLFKDSGALIVSAGLDTSRQEKAVRLIAGEIDGIRKKPLGRAELNRARVYVSGHLRLGLESTSHQMSWLGENVLAHGRVVSPREALDGLNAVTAEDIHELAEQILRTSATSLALVSPSIPEGSEKVLKDTLGVFA